MSSGVSLKRLIGPVVLFALVFTALLVVDQELIIPKLASKLVRDRDEISGQESFDVWFLNDGNNSLISSRMFAVQTSTLYWPTIILRRIKPGTNRQLEVAGLIWAERAVYNYKTHKWDLVNGRLIERGSTRGVQPIQAYDSGDLTAQDVPIMRSSQYKTLLSWSQLDRLARESKGCGPALEPEAFSRYRPYHQSDYAYGEPPDTCLPRPNVYEVSRYDQLCDHRGLLYYYVRVQDTRH